MRTDDCAALDFKDNMVLDPQTRRDFLKRLGGGIFIFVSLGDLAQAQESGRQRGGRPGLPSDFNAFLRIGEDGRVTCFTGKIEMGQGPITSLPQMLAEGNYVVRCKLFEDLPPAEERSSKDATLLERTN